SVFIKNILQNKELTVFGDGSQTRDFIYVQDVADAIYRASYSTIRGIYNLSTNTEHSILSLIQMLDKLHGMTSDVVHKEAKPGDIHRSALDNRKLFRDLDWVPMYTLEEGLQKTLDWFVANSSQTESAAAE